MKLPAAGLSPTSPVIVEAGTSVIVEPARIAKPSAVPRPTVGGPAAVTLPANVSGISEPRTSRARVARFLKRCIGVPSSMELRRRLQTPSDLLRPAHPRTELRGRHPTLEVRDDQVREAPHIPVPRTLRKSNLTPPDEAAQRASRLGLGDEDPGHDHGAAAPADGAEPVAREPEAEEAGEDGLHREGDRSPSGADPPLRPGLDEEAERAREDPGDEERAPDRPAARHLDLAGRA